MRECVRFPVQFSVSVSIVYTYIDTWCREREVFDAVYVFADVLILYLYLENARNNTRVIVPDSPRTLHDGSPIWCASFLGLKFALCRGAARQAEVFPWEIRGPCYPDKLQFPELPSASLQPLPGPRRSPHYRIRPRYLLIIAVAFPRIIIRSSKFTTR